MVPAFAGTTRGGVLALALGAADHAFGDEVIDLGF
jgi:hypothetical protein